MKISYNWLKSYINTNLSPEEISKILVNLGLEVEGLEQWQSVKGGLEGLVIGHVKECAKHPNADKLSLTKVDVGTGELLSVVCGAPNIAAGQKVVVATIGTVLYSGNESFEIKKSKIRGELSEGMICAEDEIGLGTSHDGIIVLDPSVVTGTLAKDYYKVENDWVFEIGITPNRIDSASHYGVARDLAAFLNQQQESKAVKPSVDAFKVESNNLKIDVQVDNTEACKRYAGVSIKGVTIEESPEWLQNRLKAIGQKPINNVVDITNFVLHEVGQPLHAFDADKIIGKKVIVRTMPQETPFITLDGVERKLSAEDLMICNEREGMCIGGVFGGIDSGVTESTQNVFLESAYFNPVWVRKTARRHGLSTDSSFRFERGTDPNNNIYALKRAALLIKELAGGEIVSEIVDIYPKPVEHFKVNVTFNGINTLIGKELSRDVIVNILKSLEIIIEQETAEGLSLLVPPYRVDVQNEADIVEEVLRVYGYNNVEISEKVNSTLAYSQKPDSNYLQNLMSEYLSANGYNEMMSNSLTKSAYYEKSEQFKNSIAYIINPLSSDLNCMRQTLIFGGLEAISRNINYKNASLKLYEFGNCYNYNKQEQPKNKLDQYNETYKLGLFVTGLIQEPNWNTPETNASFFFLKSYVNNTLSKLGIDLKKVVVKPLLHELYGSGLVYEYNNQVVAEFGLIKKAVLKEFDIKQEVYAGELNWNVLIKAIRNHKPSFTELPKYPEVKRDLSLLLDEKVTYEQIVNVVEKTERKLIKKVSLFDVYQGDKIEKGKKSYAISMILQDEEKTLTDTQIDKVVNNIINNLDRELGAKIR
jgi:phenylalanyl-tRNA synthetase beta chain